MRLLDYNSFINQDRQKTQSVNEHLWSGIIHRSETGRVRKENMIPCDTKEDIRKKIREIIVTTYPDKGDTIDLNNLDVSKVEDMSKLFCDYENYVDFTEYNFNVSNWDVSNVTEMSCMFVGCENFNCDLSKWDVSNVMSMEYMFNGCKKFNCDLSRWDVSNVKDMHGMFKDCEKFNSNLSGWKVSNVTDMRGMFNKCSSLQKLPKWYD